MDDYKDYKTFYENKIDKTLQNLKKNGFNAVFAPDRDQALKEVLSIIPVGAKVGIGGSLTVRQLGIIEQLEQKKCTVFDHWKEGLGPEQIKEARINQLTSDVFIASSNAVTMDGKLVNIDGVGNRVASMIYGPQKVILVAGYNKIVKDVQSGLDKIKNETTPKNALRLNFSTPCIKAGQCIDCAVPSRLCRVTTIIEAKPMQMEDFVVIIIGEKYGL